MMLGHQSRLYSVRVVHRRRVKPVHDFAYRLTYVYVNLDELPALSRRLGLLRLPLHDYGPADVQDAAGLKRFAQAGLAEVAADVSGPVCLLTMPSLFGKRFNPISLYVAHDGAGQPSAVLYEVRNTFGERHYYPCLLGNGGHHQADKQLHVSPFLNMDGHYRFALTHLGQQLHFSVTKMGRAGAELYARMEGEARPLSRAGLRNAVFGLLYQGVKVLFGIHYEALKLWIKGARFYRHPDRTQILPSRIDPISAQGTTSRKNEVTR